MKLNVLLDELDKSKENECPINIQNFAYCEFGLDSYNFANNERLKAYYVSGSYSVDTIVGVVAYYYEGTLVGLSKQSSRSARRVFYWTSEESRLLVAEYCKSLIIVAYDLPELNVLDLDQEMGIGYSVEYSENFLTDDVLYKINDAYVPVKIVYRFKCLEDFTKQDYDDLNISGNVYQPNYIRVQLPDGSTKAVRSNAVLVNYHTNVN